MYGREYLDESVEEACLKSFRRVYPEFKPRVLGVCRDKQHALIECEFSDGVFYFCVDERSVSAAYKNKDDADRG